jgi:hypothetical protein
MPHFAVSVVHCSAHSKLGQSNEAMSVALLISTETAHRFYHANGYIDDGLPVGEFGTNAGHPMVKNLLLRGR